MEDALKMLVCALVSLFVLWLVFRRPSRQELAGDINILPDPPPPRRERAVRPPWETDPSPDRSPVPLPAYDLHTICAKCGLADAEVTYRPYSPDFKWMPPSPGPNRRRWSWEHMERKCRRCGHVWAEAPVRADPAGGVA